MKDLEDRLRENEQRLSANATERASLLGKIEGHVRGLFTYDAETRELLRLRAHVQAGASIRGDMKDTPEGWPEGVDPDQFIEDQIARYMERHGAKPSEPAPAATPSVSRFRESLDES